MSTTLDTPTFLSPPKEVVGAPGWFNTLRGNSAETYSSLPEPSRKMENWRFGNLKKAKIDGFSPAGELNNIDDLDCNQLEEIAAKFIFANGDLVSEESYDLPEGVICLPLEQALTQHGDLVEKHFMKVGAKLGSEKIAALHGAQAGSGLFVFVPKNVKVDLPIEIFHWVGGDHASIFPHTLVIAGEGAEVKVIDYFQSADAETTLTVAMSDLVGEESAKLDYVAVQNVNRQSKFIQLNSISVSKEARVKNFILNLGADWARNESYSSLVGEGAHSDMLSVNIPFGEQEYDQRTFQHHVSRGAYSDLLYKNSLYDKAKTVFSGLIFVDEGAHDTDAYQTCRNLFMSDEAEANSMPGLEINADQVKCSHGSTSSQVSEEEIFYLQARGINARQAKQLIARGFSVDVIERLEDEAIEEMLLAFVDGKFASELS